jgi:SAM-dependent methyltransferase
VVASPANRVQPDPIFADPRLAAIYDDLDDDRNDLDTYVDIAHELGAQSVLDIGCGTGTLACRLAAEGIAVVGLDPARASLDVARRKAAAARVVWIEGDVTVLPSLAVDLVTMTGNVAQVFLTDDDWGAVLRASWRSLRSAGRLVFEVRDPARSAWLEWCPERTRRRLELASGTVETWTNVTSIHWPFVSFRSTFAFDGGPTVVSDSTLCFRGRGQIERTLVDSGFSIEAVRDAPDRPGLEMVFVAVKRAE